MLKRDIKKLKELPDYKEQKWHKEWDRMFKKELGAEAILTPKKSYTFNDHAKGYIESLLRKQYVDMVKKHNLLATTHEIGLERQHSETKRWLNKLEKQLKTSTSRYQEALKVISKLNI